VPCPLTGEGQGEGDFFSRVLSCFTNGKQQAAVDSLCSLDYYVVAVLHRWACDASRVLGRLEDVARRRVSEPDERRRRRRTPVWRKALCMVLVGAVAVVVFAVVRKTLRPVLLCWRERVEVKRSEARLDSVKRDIRALEEKRRYLKSGPGAEAEARKVGYVRPGEVSILFEDESGSPKEKRSGSDGRKQPGSGSHHDGL